MRRRLACLMLIASMTSTIGCFSTPKRPIAAKPTATKTAAMKPNDDAMPSISAKPSMGREMASTGPKVTADEVTEGNVDQQMKAFQAELTRDMKSFNPRDQDQAAMMRPYNR